MGTLKEFLPQPEEDRKKTIEATMEYIQKNGLKLGNRWWIREEASGDQDYLVFRDMISNKAGKDFRYIMFKEKQYNIL